MAESFWMRAKKDGICAECEADIKQDDRMVWNPEEFKAYCKVCGPDLIGEDQTVSERARAAIEERAKRASEAANKKKKENRTTKSKTVVGRK